MGLINMKYIKKPNKTYVKGYCVSSPGGGCKNCMALSQG